MDENTTIAAISTPAGSGGIGIVRLSGKDAISIAEGLFRPRGAGDIRSARGYTGMLGRVYDGEGDVDDCIAFVYRAPKSYTGEDVVELSCHGGMWVTQRVLRLCLDHGATPAAPGEFTKRAFLHGKMGLAEAEGVMDIIGAQGDAALRAALSARDGALSAATDRMVEQLLVQSAHLAAWADYPDEEIEPVDTEELYGALAGMLRDAQALLATWDQGRILREGVSTAIVGRPNVGKSTLMNLLAGWERSIVTDIPGTTRDVVEDSVRLGDFVLRLADTAGLRDTDDPVESVGVDRARRQMNQADLVLAVFDSSDALGKEDLEILAQMSQRPCVAIINKIDLVSKLDVDVIKEKIPETVLLSARDGVGKHELEHAVNRALGLDQLDPTAAMVASERQRKCIKDAADAVEEAMELIGSGMMLDAVNVSIDYALNALLSLVGKKASDQVLEQVFARFCVGK